jgi:hypothetical protein
MTSSQSTFLSNGCGRVEVSRCGRNLSFAFPETRPGDYLEVAEKLQSKGLRGPTFAETSLLVSQAFSSGEDPSFDGLLKAMRERWLWTNTAVLYWPGEGVYIQDDPKPSPDGTTLREDPFPRGLWMDRNQLRERLESGDPEVRYVPLGYEVGFLEPGRLSGNALLQGLCGDSEIARGLAEAAGGLGGNPCLSAFEEVDRPYLKVAMMGMDLHGERLEICVKGFDVGPNGNGMCAFGILET